MNRLSYSALFCVLLAMLLTSCESLVTNIPESKLPQADSKLVVQSVISPQLPFINVVVTESVPLFSKSDATEKRLKNATVRLSDGTNEIIIPYNSENNLYSLEQSRFPISAGKTYTLRVSDGKREVRGECTIPAKSPVIKSYKLDTLVLDNAHYADTAITLKLTWQDIAGDTNYYKVDAVVDLEQSVYSKAAADQFKEKRISNTFPFNWEWQQGQKEFFSDNKLDGTLFTSSTGKVSLPLDQKMLLNGKEQKLPSKTKIKSLVASVFNIDKHYFKYSESVDLRHNSENPLSEPVPLYTNIIGGYGFFAAYNATQLKVK